MALMQHQRQASAGHYLRDERRAGLRRGDRFGDDLRFGLHNSITCTTTFVSHPGI